MSCVAIAKPTDILEKKIFYILTTVLYFGIPYSLKRNVSNNRSSGNNRPDSSSTANGEHLSNGSIAVGQKRSAGQKNVKPASHTFQSSAASATRSSNSSNHKRSSNNVNNAASSVDRSTSEGGAAPSMMKNARDSRKGAGSRN